MTEIELKAHVRNPSETESKLKRFCSFQGETIKTDEYFRSGGGKTVRVREETGRHPVVTWKEKTMANGVEVNDEKEFSVSSRPLFTAFLHECGFTSCQKKEKRTKTFVRAEKLRSLRREEQTVPVSLELSEVKGLGFFLEIEILLENPSRAAQTEAVSVIKNLLARTDIPETEIEERRYTELLALKESSPLKSSVAK